MLKTGRRPAQADFGKDTGILFIVGHRRKIAAEKQEVGKARNRHLLVATCTS
jgi:hypothetical protein